MTGLLSLLLGGERRSSQSAPPRDPVIAEWWGAGATTASGQSVTADSALRSAAVYACVRVIAETLAWLPLITYRRLAGDERERDRAHRIARLLRRPNRWQTAFEFREMMTAHVLLRGVAYAEKIATGGSATAELMPLHPDRVRPFLAPDRNIAFDYAPESGPPRVILGAEMFRVGGLSTSLLRPLTPIGLHRETVGLDMAAREYGARFFANDSRPPGVLEMDGFFGKDEDRRAWLNRWRKEQTGDNRHSVALLERGIKYHALAMSNEDAQYLESRGANAVDIARIFRVPPHKIAILDRATFSNIEQQSIEFVTDTMMPWFTRWQQAIERDLFMASERESHFVEFLATALLRGDAAARSAFYHEAILDGWLTRNEVRRLENLNRIDGLDEALVPTNMTLADLLGGMAQNNQGGGGQ